MSPSSRHKETRLSKSLEGRQSNTRRPDLTTVLFKPITLLCLVLIGLFAFGALVVLQGFAADFRKAPPGQATPRSISAVGYQALTKYLDDLDYDISELLGGHDKQTSDNRLVIYTPSTPYARLKRALDNTGDEVRLIVLPKWEVGQMYAKKGETARTGWMRKTNDDSLFYAGMYDRLLDDLPVIRRHDIPSVNAQIFFETAAQRTLPETLSPDFESLQHFDLNTAWPDYQVELRKIRDIEQETRRRERAQAEGKDYTPKAPEEDTVEKEGETEPAKPLRLPDPQVLLKVDGLPVLIRLENTETYILSEPDLLNTMAFQTQSGANLAGAVINEVIWQSESDLYTADFDLGLHGFESNQNIIKLMVTPPFLAATLCLLAAGGLVAWQGFNRFGDPVRTRPDYAQGPVSLAETAAEFMEIADRAHSTGEAYAELMRRQVIATLGFGIRSSDHIGTLLDAREARLKLEPRYSNLKHAITNADMQSYSQYARALTHWRDAMTRTDTDLGQEETSL